VGTIFEERLFPVGRDRADGIDDDAVKNGGVRFDMAIFADDVALQLRPLHHDRALPEDTVPDHSSLLDHAVVADHRIFHHLRAR